VGDQSVKDLAISGSVVLDDGLPDHGNKAASTEARMIVREGPDEVLIARLAPVRTAPRQALLRLMHSLAL
jgi:hypothetical protein